MLVRRPGQRPEDLGEGLDHVRGRLCEPVGDPTADRVLAAGRFQVEFLAVVTDVVGEPNAPHYGTLLLAGAHGIAAMELSGHLGTGMLRTTADALIDTLVRMVAAAGDAT
ncbi:WHG domain-containing protein [Streptomyces sp. H27-G5]|uniref:WHG domain-containing protein n=1 Tax=Streptomyces sp. H27-G5 TaxID=2996698 RepID=UPI00226F7705|nr:WHG domain-containing protein [Streptomyces sp. H27-G5]MCY0922470.1 WHG domain-containing protein [Streptomyces sp. H27-G5]